MTFDFTTLLIQLANFALLVVLLRIFLYKPVLRIMEEREELTAAPLREARRLAAEAEDEREALRRQRAAWEQERLELLTAAAREAEELRERRLDELDRESEAKRAAAAESVEQQVGRVTDRLRSSLAHIVVDELRQTVAATAGAELETPAWHRFEERLRTLPDEERAKLAAAAHTSGVTVITPRALSSETATAARSALGEVLGASDVTFRVDPDRLMGVAIEAGGVRLDGTAAARLTALESDFARIIRDERA